MRTSMNIWTEGDVKKCKNSGCDRLIYRFQTYLQGKMYTETNFCDEQCANEHRKSMRWDTINNKSKVK